MRNAIFKFSKDSIENDRGDEIYGYILDKYQKRTKESAFL